MQIALVGGAALGGLAGDAAHTDKARQIGVQAVHAQCGAGLQDAWDLVALALTDEVCHGIGADQNLGRGAAALAPGQRQKLLGDDAAQHGGQLAADLVLRTGGADINDAVNGLGCTDRVQRAEDQMAGLGGGDGGGAVVIVAAVGAAVAGVVGYGVYNYVSGRKLQALLPEGVAAPENRAQTALLLWNTAGRPEPAETPAFADVADPDTAKAAQWCVEQGLMKRRLNGKFAPGSSIPAYQVLNAYRKLAGG